MYPISAAFEAALRTSHTAVARVDVTSASSGTTTLPVVVDGAVTVDRTSAVRRRCKLTLLDPTGTLTPTSAAALLAPYGNELRPYRGIRFESTDELVPLGVFGISDVLVTEDASGVKIELEGFDRARRVSRARFTAAYTIAAGTNVATAIRTLISSRVTGLTYSFTTTTATTPLVVFDRGSDPWDAAAQLAQSIGCELYFDADGVCVLRTEPNPLTGAVVMRYAEGAQATFVDVKRKSTDAGVYSRVVVVGETTDAPPVVGEAFDNDPSSPTYFAGPFGDVPYFVVSGLITSTQQANDAAASLLRRKRGSSESVELTALVNPAHEAGDVIEVVRSAVGVSSRYVLDGFDVPLRASGTQTFRTRGPQ